MDADPVLRSLAADLARDDPRLAALLGGTPPAPPRRVARIALVLLATPLVTLALLLAPTITAGAAAILLAVASPLAVCWLCADERPTPPPR
ncbi:DUF3040 domain-containing protein [Blastococcus colisei]|nr:DUF3040 domain-containing protein [Blastococcus colisei]